MPPVIECARLTKYYGRHRGIEELTFSVEQGETFGFLGPNGAGKTTTIRCLLGMLRATSGEAKVLGEVVTLNGSALRSRIGYVAGDPRLYEKENGRWLLDHVAAYRDGRRPLERELIDRLEFDASRRIKELSKGNRQKLALIIGLAHDPELLILDEPTSGLDPLNQQVVFDIILERVREGATLMLSSHILSEVEQVCTRVGIIRDGELVAEEDVRGLLAKRVRELEVTFAEPVGADVFDGVDGVEDVQLLGETTLTARVKGESVDPLLKRLAERTVLDVRIDHASLEDVFMEYYRGSDRP